MISAVRAKYNAEFTDEKYQTFLADLKSEYGQDVEFRVPETPVFVPKELKNKIIQACEHIVDTMLLPNFKSLTDRAIPQPYYVNGEEYHPHFLALDFGVCLGADGNFEPQLIEMQGFPSLFGFEHWVAGKYKQHFYCPDGFSHLFNGLTPKTYLALLHKTILGDSTPEHVVLMDIKPELQKTKIDFWLTEKYLGIKTVCVTDVYEEQGALWYINNGKPTQVERIYNRFIFDDLRHYPDLNIRFDFKNQYPVKWITHPHWFYRLSKFTMPFLEHPYVPTTHFLNEVVIADLDPAQWVLKPLFSFAGQGVNIDITHEDLKAVKDPENWIIQKKVQYVDAIQAPNGGVKCELRMLYLWPDGDSRPTLAVNLSRMSKGKMIGVRYNKDFDWVGGNVAFFEQD